MPGEQLARVGDQRGDVLRSQPETLIELLRQLMERQAVHRIEGGTLSEDEIERLGATFMALADRMEDLKQAFGLSDEDLNLNLGPLGSLL